MKSNNLLFILLALLISKLACSKDILIPNFAAKNDANGYYMHLAALALKHSDNEADTVSLKPTLNMDQGRALLELEKGTLDLVWVGANSALNSRFRAVEIPLDKGLMGYRSLLIRKQNFEVFTQIKNLKQLAKLVACQGENWPDTPILVAAGLIVLDSPVYLDLYEQLHNDRCDYFPRGLHEGAIEILHFQEKFPDFMVFNSLILHYPFTVYFYTSKQNEWLARRLEKGLENMIDSGELYKFMQTRAETAHVFPLSQWATSTILELTNPDLSESTDTNNPRYWFSSKNFKH
jgi:hypothetical protein